MAADARDRVQLVHHDRIHYERRLAYGKADLVRDKPAQVRGVLALNPGAQVAQHGLVHAVCAADHGLEKPAPADDAVHILRRDAGLLEHAEYRVLAEPVLVGHLRVAGQVARLVAQCFVQNRGFVLVHAYFRGGGTGVDYKKFHEAPPERIPSAIDMRLLSTESALEVSMTGLFAPSATPPHFAPERKASDL